MKNHHHLNTEPQSRSWSDWIRFIFCWGIVLLLGSTMVATASAQGGGPDLQARPDKPGGKLSFRLELLAQPAVSRQDAETQARTLSLPVSGPGSLLKNEQGEILVYIRLTELATAHLRALTEAGAKIVHVAEEYRTVTAYVGPDRLTTVASVAAVEHMREEFTPWTAGAALDFQPMSATHPARPTGQADCPGATTSEGDNQLRANQARNTLNLDGAEVIVGVLSDSYARVSFPTSATTDIATGDLPGASNPCGQTNPINVIAEGPVVNATDEGRAMLQIVHDLAPGARLAFATAFNGIFDFATQIRALRNAANSDIIVDDVSYFFEPFFQDGPVSVAIQDVTAAGAMYFTSAGNSHREDAGGNALTSAEAPAYRATNCPPGLPPFAGPTCHDFDPGPGADNRGGFTLASGGSLILAFQWAEPWFGVQTDLDLYLVNDAGAPLAASFSDNFNDQIPFEFFNYTNSTGLTQNVHLVINRYAGAATPRLKYIMIRSSGLTAAEYSAANSSDVFGPTVFGHSGEDTALSIAAVPFDDANTPEEFTSRGFPTYYFGPTEGVPQPAAPLAAPQTRQKPDVAATNGGCNTFFGQFSAGCFRFFGTSAAAPHAAAVAALLKQQADRAGRSFNQTNAESTLETTTAAMAAGSIQATGAGLIDALAAVNTINPLDLSTSNKTVKPDRATVNQVVTYTVRLINSGTLNTATVSFTDTLPATLNLTGSPAASSGSPPAVNGRTLTWTGNIATGQVVTLTYAARLTSTNTNRPIVINSASINDGQGNVYIRQAFVNGVRVYLPVTLKGN